MLKLKRAYDKKEASDGHRVLADRLWPRGLSRTNAGIDEWLKELAPSDGLRRWFGHEPEKWPDFRKKYMVELAIPEKQAQLKRLADMAAADVVTLVYAAKDTEHNNALVLKEVIEKQMAVYSRP